VTTVIARELFDRQIAASGASSPFGVAVSPSFLLETRTFLSVANHTWRYRIEKVLPISP
jgi:hypothetical protein